MDILRKCMKQLASFLDAKDTCLYVQTYEEVEFVRDVCTLVRGLAPYKIPTIDPDKAEVYTYSRFEGLYKVNLNNIHDKQAYEPIKDVKNITQLFQFIRKKQNNEDTSVSSFNGFDFKEEISQGQESNTGEVQVSGCSIFILKDMHLFFDKDTIRAFRDLKEDMEEIYYSPIIVTSPTIDLPCELEKLFTYFSYDIPEVDDIFNMLCPDLSVAEYTNEEILNIANSCVGLTEREISRALFHSLAAYEDIDVRIIQEEKVQIVKKSGALDYLTPEQTLEDTGGYPNFKVWVKELKNAMEPEAITYGVPQPKGAMLVGLPGNGKTMAAEVIANYLNIPLLQLDLARIMGSFVGQSEKQIANALRLAKACAPCVMLIDEAEKLFSGIQSSGQCDSGTLSRVLAQLLQFLQESNTGVITIMTSNNVFELPPELTRSGRLDAQWYFGFPNVQERREILDIYLAKNKLVVPTTNLMNKLVRDTDNYSGAELKEVVKHLVIKAYYRQKEAGITEMNRNVTLDDINRSVASVIPVYVSSQEKVTEFIKLAKGRYRIASAEAV